MVMDKGGILRNYKAARHKLEQVKILAELNDCTPAEIVGVIAEQTANKSTLSRLIGEYGCEPPIVKPKHKPANEPAMAVLEDREITVTEAVDRLRRELDELDRRQYELDMERADFYRMLWEMLGGVS